MSYRDNYIALQAENDALKRQLKQKELKKERPKKKRSTKKRIKIPIIDWTYALGMIATSLVGILLWFPLHSYSFWICTSITGTILFLSAGVSAFGESEDDREKQTAKKYLFAFPLWIAGSGVISILAIAAAIVIGIGYTFWLTLKWLKRTYYIGDILEK